MNFSCYVFLLGAVSTQGLIADGRIMSMKNCSDITIGNRTLDLPACNTVPQPTASPCTACYFVSTDIYPYLYISKQSLNLLTEFSYRCVCLSVCLPRKFSAAANVFFLPFIANNSKHAALSWVKNSAFPFRLSQSAVLIEDNFILSGIPDRCNSHDELHYASLLRPHWSKYSPHHIVLKSS